MSKVSRLDNQSEGKILKERLSISLIFSDIRFVLISKQLEMGNFFYCLNNIYLTNDSGGLPFLTFDTWFLTENNLSKWIFYFFLGEINVEKTCKVETKSIEIFIKVCIAWELQEKFHFAISTFISEFFLCISGVTFLRGVFA
jgi:hypothetical protein